MSRMISFDDITYHGVGNEVEVVVRIADEDDDGGNKVTG